MSIEHYTILLVEDDPNDVLLMERAFKKAEIKNPIQVVNDGEEAINYLSGGGNYADRNTYPLPALTLLDLKLPRKSGFEVLEWVKSQPELKRLPVIILTSSQENPDVQRAYNSGANSYLVKPVTFDALFNLVKSLNLYWMMLSEKPEV